MAPDLGARVSARDLTVLAVISGPRRRPGPRCGSYDCERSHRRTYVSMAIGNPTCWATGVQMSVSTPGVSMETSSA